MHYCSNVKERQKNKINKKLQSFHSMISKSILESHSFIFHHFVYCIALIFFLILFSFLHTFIPFLFLLFNHVSNNIVYDILINAFSLQSDQLSLSLHICFILFAIKRIHFFIFAIKFSSKVCTHKAY